MVPCFFGKSCKLSTFLKNLARKKLPCKILQGKNYLARSCKKQISLQDIVRKKFPCKILQGKNFLARSCKEKISLQDLARNKFPCKILQVIAFLQGSCKILARNAFSFNQGIHKNYRRIDSSNHTEELRTRSVQNRF